MLLCALAVDVCKTSQVASKPIVWPPFLIVSAVLLELTLNLCATVLYDGNLLCSAFFDTHRCPDTACSLGTAANVEIGETAGETVGATGASAAGNRGTTRN
jgi:hypothetical protein